MQEAVRYCILPPAPVHLGLTERKNKTDKRDTRVMQGLKHFHPMAWYIQSLKWPASDDPEPAGAGITWLELAVDYVLATGRTLTRPGTIDPGPVSRQLALFQAAMRRVAQLHKGKVSPSRQTLKCTALADLGYSPMAGFVQRPQIFYRPQVRGILQALRDANGAEWAAASFTWGPKPPLLWRPPAVMEPCMIEAPWTAAVGEAVGLRALYHSAKS